MAWLVACAVLVSIAVLHVPAAAPLDVVLPALERPDRVSAGLLARAEGRRVEVTDLRSEDSSTWVNPDGSYTTEMHAGPIRVWREANAASGSAAGWRDIDVSLVSVASGVHPVAAKPSIVFSRGGSGAAASMGFGGRSVGFSLEGVSLPAPTLSGAVARYRDVWPGIDLELEARPAGFAKRLIIRERPRVAPVWRLPLVLAGQSISQDASGNLTLRDSKGRTTMVADPALMWGANLDSVSQDPSRYAKVATRIIGGAGAQKLELAPDFGFLSDPSVALPIVVDPSPTLFAAADTFVQSDWNQSQWTTTELRSGTWNGGSSVTRSLLKFDMASLTGKHILSATMKLYNSYSSSAYNRQAYVYALGGSFISSTNWGTQPPTSGGIYSSAWLGQTTPAWVNFGLTDLVAEWAAGTRANYGVQVRMASETDSLAYRRFHSADNATAKPILDVTYNSYPNTPTYPLPVSAVRINSLRPTLSAMFGDGDGGNGAARFDVYKNSDGSPVFTSQQGSWVASGQRSNWTLPSNLVEGTTYKWRARGYDGIDNGINYSSYYTFTPDITAPGMPSVSSTDYPAAAWAKGAGQAGDFTFSSSASDLAGYLWELDNPVPQNFVAATGSKIQSVTPATEGPHTLYVRAKDTAGNVSAVTSYSFNVGTVGVTAPADGDSTQRSFTLNAVSLATSTAVTYQYSRGNGSFTTIPAGDVTQNGTPLTVWPVTAAGGIAPTLVWDAAATLGFVDGPVQLRAVFTGAGTPTSAPIDLTLDQKAFRADYATAPAGPGSVNLVTGNLGVSETDVSIAAWGSDLSVSRSFNSRDHDASSSGIFGPGWTASLPNDAAGSDYVSLHSGEEASQGAFVTVLSSDGETISFTKQGVVYVAEDGYEDLTLTRPTGQYKITDLDGNITIFTKQTAGPDYVPGEIIQPGSASGKTTYSWEVVNGVTRITRILAPIPATVTSTCATLVAGCRALTFTYASTTTATGTSEATWGDFSGRLKTVTFTAYNPGVDNPVVASYLYDSTGRLRAAWNPRISPALKTRYSYNSDNRIATITPPGEAAWTFAYQTITGDSDPGRLRSVARTGPQGTATTTYVYEDVSLSSPYDLTSSATDRWAQRDKPTLATAVFPPQQTPTTPPVSFERATIYYINADGRAVNVAGPGGHITTTEYDAKGNMIRSLSASNRAAALTSSSDPALQAAQATLLDTDSIYSEDGQQLLDEYGPLTEMTLADGTIVQARSHTQNIYDENAPTGGPYNLITTTKTGARRPGDTAELDVRTSTTSYDWTLRQPTEQITDPVGLNLRTTTVYDSATGLVIASRLPANPSGGDARETKTLYYTGGTQSPDSVCQNKPQWANLVCKIYDGTSTGPILPVKAFTYNLWNQPDTITETIGSTVRTTTLGYDAAGRQADEAITGGVGTAIPTVTSSYDTATGRLTTSQTTENNVTRTITRSYDSLGRLTSYTDADGKTTTRTYNVYDQLTQTSDDRGTITYSYDAGTERRGLLTGLAVSGITGSFAATYNSDGIIATKTYPNDLVATYDYNATGAATSLVYDKQTNCGTACRWLSFTITESAHGQWRTAISELSEQDYSYDAAARLSIVKDTPAGQGCTTRSYAFDANSNRTSLTTRTPQSDGSCDLTSAGTTQSRSYDTADRSTLTGYTYDSFGRATAIPAGDAGAATSATYHVNDLVASITQNSITTSYALDPARRIRSQTTTSGTRINHYAGDSDSPSWSEQGTNWSRNIGGIDGDLAAIQTTTSTELQLTNPHGDIIATASPTTTVGAPLATLEQTEYGIPRAASTREYGWLGAKQRPTDPGNGIVLMGVRLYLPGAGRFLQVDPVAGGSCNSYDYTCADPINAFDLDGRFAWRKFFKRVARVAVAAATVASMFSCPVCTAIGYGLAAYSAYKGARAFQKGDWGGVGWAVADITGVGLGRMASKAGKVARFVEKRASASRSVRKASMYAGKAAKWRHRSALYKVGSAAPNAVNLGRGE